MNDLDACFAGLDTFDPDNATPRVLVADLLDETRWGWGHALRSACEIHRQVPGITLPDRFPTFRTPSNGWGAVGTQLEAMAERPEDTDAFRARYHRLVRGDVPLDPENLEPTLRLQYDLQVRLLDSLNLLEWEDDTPFITAVDGKRYLLHEFRDVFSWVRTPELLEKLRQGFDTLLLVPFGLPLERFFDAWREGIRRNADVARGPGYRPDVDSLYVGEDYSTEPLFYDPHTFTADHGGRTKLELLARRARGFEVLLVEGAVQNLRLGEEVGRSLPTFGPSPEEFLRVLPADEVGQKPEGYVIQFLDAVERSGRALDTDITQRTISFLPGAFMPTRHYIPCGYRSRCQYRLSGTHPTSSFSFMGGRSAVSVA